MVWQWLSSVVCALQAEEGEQEEPQQQKRQPVPLPHKVPLPLPQPPQAVSGAGLLGGLGWPLPTARASKRGSLGFTSASQCWVWRESSGCKIGLCLVSVLGLC